MEAKDGSAGFDFAGTYTKIETHKLIQYQFGDRHAKVDFTPDENGVCVTVTFETETELPIEQQRSGWQSILDNFKRYVEAASKASALVTIRTKKLPLARAAGSVL